MLDIVEQRQRMLRYCMPCIKGSDAASDYNYRHRIPYGHAAVSAVYTHIPRIFRHLTGDALATVPSAIDIELENIDYIQIHPTTLYSDKARKTGAFLISESVRGEGAKLYDKNGKRFVNELLPRDLLTEEIRKQMAKDNTDFVWEDLRTIPEEELKTHFPNIVQYCIDKGYDPSKECIPVVPAQHYFMGGIKVDHEEQNNYG